MSDKAGKFSAQIAFSSSQATVEDCPATKTRVDRGRVEAGAIVPNFELETATEKYQKRLRRLLETQHANGSRFLRYV